MEVVGAVASLVSAFVDCAKLLHSNTKNLFKLQSNLNALQQKQNILKDLKDHVSSELEAAAKDGNFPAPQAKEWLTQVEEVMVVADPMTQPGMPPHNTTLSGCLFNCGLSIKLSKTLKKVERLVDFDLHPGRIIAINHQAKSVEYIPTTSIQDHPCEAISHGFAKVMDLLRCDGVRRIGVWGMGGVGKTTLVKNLNNKLKSHGSAQPYGLVIWVTVSKDFNKKRVQSQIAERLSLAVGESDEDRMAIRLHERLQREEKFLLILDDVWQAIDLNLLGIPQPQVHVGGKVILTSRSLRVCIQMKTDEQVKLSVMNHKESWRLFSSTVGRVVDSECIKPIAEEVVKQCSGLPLAIVIVGAAMRGKESIPLWHDALSELQRSVPLAEDMEEEVFKPLKWSYDRLQGKGVKSCFLYCCLYPEDFCIKISELVQCWVGEGLIGEELDHERSLNRGNALIQNLKDACLLEPGDQEGTVKMHDVVRDVAIWIASSDEDGSKSLVRAGIGLTQVPEVGPTDSLKRVSFMNNNIRSLLGNNIECSGASTLFLQGNKNLEVIPEEFLQGFQRLKVLSISGTKISTLPSSILQLSNLRTLVLRGCNNLKELPISGWETLRTMLVLGLSQTDIKALPRGMQHLSKLRELYLLSTKGLESIPNGVFSMLLSLEILQMQGSKYVWGDGSASESEASLEELGCLERLRTLSIRLQPKTALNLAVNLTWIRRLVSFQLYIGLSTHCEAKKGIIIDSISNVSREVRIDHLLSSTDATYLKLDSCGGLNHMLQNMALNSNACFSALTSLYIVNTNFTRSGAGCEAKMDLLPNLEQLHLSFMSHMGSISELAGLLGLRFRRLRSLFIKDCGSMRYLLSLGQGLVLENLREMRVQGCRELEAVFKYEHGTSAEEQEHEKVVPNLGTVQLTCLPELRTLVKSNLRETWVSVERIEVNLCDQLRKLPLSSQNVENNTLKEIMGDELWWNQLEWDDQCTKNSLQHFFKPYLFPSLQQVKFSTSELRSIVRARKTTKSRC